ncbi:MAG: sigma-70 family RNA polymerase sigma factor [Treponema sp.]|nr:sigma-70 family RNA polymerase sigma factor [Treponema sp.]
MNFDTIFQENYVYIYNFALKLSCHPQNAEDLTQQTFMTAYEKMDQLKEEKALRKWLTSICYRHFLIFLRKSAPVEETLAEIEALENMGAKLPELLPQPEEEVIVADEIKRLQNGCFMAMVRKLSLKQRIAFSLIDMFGMQTDYVAELLEVSPNALKGLLFRARMNLDSFFAGHCNLLDAKNPCSCAAWIAFRESHEENQLKMKETIAHLDYEKAGYRFDHKVRAKVQYLYSHLPEMKPRDDWFSKVIAVFA